MELRGSVISKRKTVNRLLRLPFYSFTVYDIYLNKLRMKFQKRMKNDAFATLAVLSVKSTELEPVKVEASVAVIEGFEMRPTSMLCPALYAFISASSLAERVIGFLQAS